MLPRRSRFLQKEDLKYKMRNLLKNERNVCYILITCKEASEDGKMQVEMQYEGDTELAAYLIDNAQEFFAKELG